MKNITKTRKEDRPFSSYWLVTNTIAHPLWTQYLILLVDLTTKLEQKPFLLREDMSYEVHVYAVNPDFKDINLEEEVNKGTLRQRTLHPANHGYQFIATNDEEAKNRIEDIARGIEHNLINPDTDATRYWDKMFNTIGGLTLKK